MVSALPNGGHVEKPANSCHFTSLETMQSEPAGGGERTYKSSSHVTCCERISYKMKLKESVCEQ